jgi:hypothetical protein
MQNQPEQMQAVCSRDEGENQGVKLTCLPNGDRRRCLAILTFSRGSFSFEMMRGQRSWLVRSVQRQEISVGFLRNASRPLGGAIIITYDEFGGQWDHVPPPPYNYDRNSPADAWGPGTRIPAILISKRLPRSGVDHTAHDTTSIIKLIEERFHIAPLSSRDAKVQSLRSALDAAD